jgi:hypothetical protein
MRSLVCAIVIAQAQLKLWLNRRRQPMPVATTLQILPVLTTRATSQEPTASPKRRPSCASKRAVVRPFRTLMMDDKGIWRGKASKDGKSVDVTVDFQGNINAR